MLVMLAYDTPEQRHQNFLRKQFERVGGTRVQYSIYLFNGELRGAGGYVLLPPSVHPSGHVYLWAVPLPAGEVPRVDALKAGLACERADCTERQTDRDTETQKTASVSLCSLSNADKESLAGVIDEVVKLALPRDVHQNHKALFTLARGVKAIEKHVARRLSQQELSEVFAQWYGAAKACLQPDQTRQEYWFEFLEGYEHVKKPIGEGVLKTAWEAAQKSPLPKVAMQFENAQIRLLVALCRELQRAVGDAPFYLSCRMARTLLRPDSHNTTAFWLRVLARNKIIEAVEKGGPDTNKATRYRYLHPLNE